MVHMVAVHHIILVLCYVQVESGPGFLHCFPHHLQACIRNGKGSVSTNQTTYQRATLCSLCKTKVFCNSGFHFFHATIAVGYLIAGSSSHSNLFHTICNGIQGTCNIGRTGVVVNAGGCSTGNGVDRADQRAVVTSFLIQCPVDTPPPLLQDLDEISLGTCRGKHAPGESGIVVVMGTYIAGNDCLASPINDLVSLYCICNTLADLADDVIYNDNIYIILHHKWWLGLHDSSLFDYRSSHNILLTLPHTRAGSCMRCRPLQSRQQPHR